MVYDGDGNRVAETVGGTATKYLVDTLNPTGYAQVMDELVSGAVTRTYTYGLQRISENQKIGATQTASFYGYDGHGNVRLLTGTTGTVTDTYEYDAFGLPLTTTGTTPNNYLYSGEQFDSVLGMYYLRARYYNPATGRFLTRDSFDGDVRDPGTLHKYIYTRNDPTNRADPRGLADEEEEEFIIEFDLQNLSQNVHRIAQSLQLTSAATACAIHALKADIAGQFEGNPDVLVDVTNGNAFLPVSFEFVGCILSYLPAAE